MLEEADEYAGLLTGNIHAYLLVLKAEFYRNTGSWEKSVECIEQAAKRISVSGRADKLNAWIEYYIARGFTEAGRFRDAWVFFDACRKKLQKLYYFERLLVLDYYEALSLIYAGGIIPAKEKIDHIIRYFRIRGDVEIKRLLPARALINVLAGHYREVLDDLQKESLTSEDRLFEMCVVVVYYILAMSDQCRQAYERCRREYPDDDEVQKFTEAIELALADEHIRGIEICEQLTTYTRPYSLMRLFYLKVCEIIAAKNGLYELEIRFLRMREKIAAEYRRIPQV
jgi:tetratricopeptide (TPR) repeat protein